MGISQQSAFDTAVGLRELLMLNEARDFCVSLASTESDLLRRTEANHDAYRAVLIALDAGQAIVIEAREHGRGGYRVIASVHVDPAITSSAFISEHVVLDARWRKR